MKVIIATKGVWYWLLTKLNLDGYTTYWAIYIKPLPQEQFEVVLKHELTHVEQMKREGKVVFSIKYLYYLIKYGYWNNPYEIEARKEAG